MKQVFDKCKNSLSQAAILAHPNPKAELTVTTDASNSNRSSGATTKKGMATAGILQQKLSET